MERSIVLESEAPPRRAPALQEGLTLVKKAVREPELAPRRGERELHEGERQPVQLVSPFAFDPGFS